MTNVIIAAILVTPIVLAPVAFVWYLNIAGLRAAVRAAHAKTVTAK